MESYVGDANKKDKAFQAKANRESKLKASS
jgi:hypothetical protein